MCSIIQTIKGSWNLLFLFKISYRVLPFHIEHISNNACFILVLHLPGSELCRRRIMRSRHESFHSEMLYGLKDMVTMFYFESKLCCLGFEDGGYKTVNFRATTSWFLIIRNLTRNNLLSICPILYEKNSCREVWCCVLENKIYAVFNVFQVPWNWSPWVMLWGLVGPGNCMRVSEQAVFLILSVWC